MSAKLTKKYDFSLREFLYRLHKDMKAMTQTGIEKAKEWRNDRWQNDFDCWLNHENKQARQLGALLAGALEQKFVVNTCLGNSEGVLAQSYEEETAELGKKIDLMGKIMRQFIATLNVIPNYNLQSFLWHLRINLRKITVEDEKFLNPEYCATAESGSVLVKVLESDDYVINRLAIYKSLLSTDLLNASLIGDAAEGDFQEKFRIEEKFLTVEIRLVETILDGYLHVRFPELPNAQLAIRKGWQVVYLPKEPRKSSGNYPR